MRSYRILEWLWFGHKYTFWNPVYILHGATLIFLLYNSSKNKKSVFILLMQINPEEATHTACIACCYLASSLFFNQDIQNKIFKTCIKPSLLCGFKLKHNISNTPWLLSWICSDVVRRNTVHYELPLCVRVEAKHQPHFMLNSPNKNLFTWWWFKRTWKRIKLWFDQAVALLNRKQFSSTPVLLYTKISHCSVCRFWD